MTAFPIPLYASLPSTATPGSNLRGEGMQESILKRFYSLSFRNITIIVGVLLAGVVFVIISCYLYKYHPKFCRACGPWLMLCEACDKPSNDINYIGSSQRPGNDCCKGDCAYPGSVCDLLCCLVPDSQGDDSDCKPSCECNDCGGDCGDCDCGSCDCGSCDCGSCDCGDCAIM